jgi:hypothetical protein
MRINLFLLADYANISEDKKLNIMGIFTEINAYQFPIRHSSMHLVLSMSPDIGEFGENRTLRFRLFDPDGKEIFSLPLPCSIPNPQHGRKPTINFVVNLRDVIFPVPGPYNLVLQLDKDQKAEITLYANKVDLPQPPQQQLAP